MEKGSVNDFSRFFFLYIFSLVRPIAFACNYVTIEFPLITEPEDLSKPKELNKNKSGKDYRTRDHLALFKHCFRVVKSELLGKCLENIAKVQFDRHCAKQANFR